MFPETRYLKGVHSYMDYLVVLILWVLITQVIIFILRIKGSLICLKWYGNMTKKRRGVV